MVICNNCNQNPVPSYRKTLCDECAEMKQSAYDAKSSQPIAQPVPVNPPVQKIPATGNEIEKETGTFQSTVWNHKVAANSYEVGKVGDRFKLYFENPEELLKKIRELKIAGFMQEEFKPEHIPES